MELTPTSRPLDSAPNYDGITFGAVDGSAGHAVGHYRQDGDLVTVQIAGGTVRTGRLVGTVDENGVLDAGYCMVLTDGEIVAGRCVSTPSTLDDGRLMLTEQWNRIDGSSGTSYIASLAQPTAGGDAHQLEQSAGGVSP